MNISRICQMKDEELLMRKKRLLLFGILSGVLCFGMDGLYSGTGGADIRLVCAQNQSVEYIYDSLGRVKTVIYSNGVEVTYEYDKNGNLLSCQKTVNSVPGTTEEGTTEENQSEHPVEPSGGETTEKDGSSSGSETTEKDGSLSGSETTEKDGGLSGSETTEKVDSTSGDPAVEQPSGLTTTQQTKDTSTEYDSRQTAQQEVSRASDLTPYTAKDIRQYNQFKRKKPVIRSLKITKQKKKYYLKIKIRQIKKRGVYGETGYQIKYAANSKWKNAKTIKIKRSKKGTLTAKQWSVKKGKTYYIKVRAYMKTKKGKIIYSKYSKGKKITITK